MRLLIIYCTVLILANIISCRNQSESYDIKGKWYSFSRMDGYVEYYINSDTVHPYMHVMGNMFPQKYIIKGDTIQYFHSDYKATIINNTDSIFIFNSNSRSDTLIRLNDTILTFFEIKNENDSIIKEFHSNFKERAHISWIKHGYITEEELKKSFLDKN